MKYAVLVYETAKELERRAEPPTGGYWGAYAAYNQSMIAAGIAAGGNALHPPESATTVRMRGGERIVQDGPFADTKEQLGGLFIIDVPDLDAAIAWAARCPSASAGSAEIRPILEMGRPA